MPEVKLAAVARTEFGKGAARRIRRAHKVPAVLYGHGSAPRHVSLPSHDLMRALKGGANTLLRLDLGDGTELALPRAVTRDPLKGSFEHLDLLLVRQGEKVTVDVPIELTGDAPTDGLVDQQVVVLSVEAEATHIPTSLSLSIQGLRIGGSLTAKDVHLPAGIALAGDPDTVIVHVMAEQSAEQFEAEMEGAEAEAGAGASGAAEQAAAAAEGEPEPAPDSAGDGAVGGEAGSAEAGSA